MEQLPPAEGLGALAAEREAVQVLTSAVLHVTGGAARDDATVLITDWHGSSRSLPAQASWTRSPQLPRRGAHV